MKPWPDDDAVLTGAAHRPWPEPGCRCRACLVGPVDAGGRRSSDGSDAGEAVTRRPTALTWGPVTLVADGHRGPGATTRTLDVGGTDVVGDVRLFRLPASGPGTVLVAGRGGRSLLWAPVAGPLPPATLQALQDGGLDAVVLDVRGADGAPDLPALAHDLARLRAAGALAPRASVLAVGWSHDCDPARSADLLATWGVGGVVAPPWRTLVLGAASSGKSQYAEALLAAEPAVDYLATAAAAGPDDHEWAAKVAEHRRRRPSWWRTRETVDLAGVLATPGPPVLLDSLGTWTAATLGRCGAWDDGADWQQQWDREVAAVVQAWRSSARRVVAVAEETGWGVVPATSAGRRFRDALGTLNRRLADESERVVLVVAGQPLGLTPTVGGDAL